MLGRLFRALVPDEIVMTVGEIDILFMKDGSPLEWSTFGMFSYRSTVCLAHIQHKHTVQFLACFAVAVFRIQWRFSAQLILHSTTVTATFVTDMEILVAFMEFVRSASLPLVEFFGAHIDCVRVKRCSKSRDRFLKKAAIQEW